MNNALQQIPEMLIATPQPKSGESVLGFLLRAAELNGYKSINQLFSIAHMSANESRSARPSLKKLAPIFGKSEDALVAAGLDAPNEGGTGRHLNLAGHVIPSFHMKSKHAGVCPECVKGKGYIESFFELKYALGCPSHGIRVLEFCPECNKKVNWRRKGLAKCNCGCDFSEAAVNSIHNPGVVALLGILRCKLFNIEFDEVGAANLGFPVEAIQHMSLNTLLALIHRFSSAVCVDDGNYLDLDHSRDWKALVVTAEVLSNWPKGFHKHLMHVHASGANLSKLGLRGQFNSFYESLFKTGIPAKEVAFLREAFVEFGQVHWQNAHIHSNLIAHEDRKLVGINELAAKLNVQPRNVHDLVRRGELIPVKTHEKGNLLFDTSQPLPKIGKTLSLRVAAKRLGVPSTVLREFRKNGYYVASYAARPVTAYNQIDVESLHAQIRHNAKPIATLDPLGHISLSDIMQMKFGNIEIKSDLLKAMMDGRLKPLGYFAECVDTLVFDYEQVMGVVESLEVNLQYFFNIKDSKEECNLAVTTVKLLYAEGQVVGFRKHGNDWISRKSMAEFLSRYTACTEIAALKGLSLVALSDLCYEIGIEFHYFGSHIRQVKHGFITNEQLSILGLLNG